TWRPNDHLGATLRGSAFQQVQEFRVGQGLVLGFGGMLDIGLTQRMDLTGGADLYQQTFKDRPGALDWNQLRGWMTLRIGFGDDPGMQQGGGR
ncbi:MAG TPA: hypothetical protein VJ957_03280, partial [Longimicrobiales bacterium]|nr:hypothetical protein [Longimicrobiales bacterium]